MKKASFNTVILSAPPGWGKTTAQRLLQQIYGCEGVVDDWRVGDPVKLGHLHLTSETSFPTASFAERCNFQILIFGA